MTKYGLHKFNLQLQSAEEYNKRFNEIEQSLSDAKNRYTELREKYNVFYEPLLEEEHKQAAKLLWEQVDNHEFSLSLRAPVEKLGGYVRAYSHNIDWQDTTDMQEFFKNVYTTKLQIQDCEEERTELTPMLEKFDLAQVQSKVASAEKGKLSWEQQMRELQEKLHQMNKERRDKVMQKMSDFVMRYFKGDSILHSNI